MAYGQSTEAYDDYISIASGKNTVVKVTENDIYDGSLSLKIISISTNDPSFSADVAGINIKIKYNVEGSYVIEYEICKKNNGSECSTAFLHINITNEKISAANDVYAITNDDEQKFSVLENDLFKEPATLSIINNTKFGTAQVTNKTIKYKPNDLNFVKDSLQYRIEDKNNNKSKAYVYVYNNDPPEAKNTPPEISEIKISIKEDEAFNFNLSQFTNAYTDKENDPLEKMKFLSLPNNGKLIYSNNEVKIGEVFESDQIKNLQYIPDKDYFGSDEIKWHAADHSDYSEAPAIIYIDITAVNDAPVAVNDSYDIKEGETPQLDVLENDYDPEKESITITKVEMDAKYGKTTIKNNKIQFTPTSQYNGQANFTYFISDGDLAASADVTVNIAPINESPVAQDFNIQLNEDENFVFAVKNFTDHYEDPDGQALTHIAFSALPGKGQLYLGNQPVNKNSKIKAENINDLVYRPKSNYFGSDQASYRVYDANDQSSPANIMIDITSVNDLPTAVDDAGFEITEGASVIIDVLKNDSDLESEKLKIIEVFHNSIEYELTENNQVKVIPDTDFCGELIIEYTIEDEDGGTAKASIFINVICQEDVATVTDIDVEMTEDEEYIFQPNLFREATNDPDGDSLQAIIINELANNGLLYLSGEEIQPEIQISVNQIELLKFKPDYNWNGATSFTWQAITKSVISENQALVNIKVHPYADDLIIYDGISPNGDGMNDQWVIVNIGDYPENKVEIFNRFNLLIYRQTNYDNEANVWKGETNMHHFNQEHLAPDDIYYYVITLNNGEKVLKGAVTLKR